MSDEQGRVIADVARRLGVPGSWLDGLINFETAGTYDPRIKNPYSSARGLIQITDARARDIGYNDSMDAVTRNPDFSSQMYNVVYPALKPYVPFENKQALYMAVFYPAYRDVPPDTAFPPNVRKVNPGIDTVQDYIDHVDRRIVLSALRLPKLIPVLILAAIGAGVWIASRRRKAVARR